MPAPLKTTIAAKNRAREMRAAGASVRAVCRALEAEHGLSETTGRRVVRALDEAEARRIDAEEVARLPPVATSAPIVLDPAMVAAALVDAVGSASVAADYLARVLEAVEEWR